jgi:hypothetical protein
VKNISILLIGLAVVGCSGETTTSREITNQSSQEVVIQLYSNGQSYGDSIILAPGDFDQFSVKTYNKAQEDEDACAYSIDSAYTRTSNGGKVTKDFSNNSNWDVESDKTKEIPAEYEHTCVFTIRDSDISE